MYLIRSFHHQREAPTDEWRTTGWSKAFIETAQSQRCYDANQNIFEIQDIIKPPSLLPERRRAFKINVHVHMMTVIYAVPIRCKIYDRFMHPISIKKNEKRGKKQEEIDDASSLKCNMWMQTKYREKKEKKMNSK